jgi:hypothetical protein
MTNASCSAWPCLVTYNGAAFDAQVGRCWLAGIRAEMAEGPKRVQLNFRDLADGRLDGTGSWGLTDGGHN